MTTAERLAPAPPPAPPPVLAIAVERVDPVAHAAVPTLRFTARVRAIGSAPVRSVSLTAQIRIATDRRRYRAEERDRLVELLGTDPHRAAPALLWAHATVQVPPFDGETVVDIPLACTYDFDVAAAKYLHAVGDGEVPLQFLFSGTVFYTDAGRLRAARLPWDTEATLAMPASVWREAMDQHFPGAAWLRLDRDTFDALYAYRRAHTLPTWTDTVRALLAAAGQAPEARPR